jgi:hypothetical protein
MRKPMLETNVITEQLHSLVTREQALRGYL